MDSFQTRGNRVLGLFFPHYCGRHRLWFHANQFDCVRSLLVFCFSQNRLQSRCNFADQYVNFADTHWSINWFFFFSSLLENWTSFPLTTYSQTDTKAFFLHDFIGFLFCLIYVLFKATSVLIFLLGSSVWEHCYKVCSSVNRGGIYFVHCKSATETSLDMAAVLFLYRRFRFL